MLTLSRFAVKTEKIPILEDINLTLESDKVYMLLGPNGSGKSTLTKSIAGDPSLQVSAQKAEYLGKNLLSMSAEERSREGIFLAYQSSPEIEGLNVFAYLKLIYSKYHQSLSNLHLSAKEFNEILAQKMSWLGLGLDFKNRDFNVNFSGGERKKMEILQMLLLEPRLVILDEIDSGVDADSLRLILETLRNYKVKAKEARNPVTLLFITHNLTLSKKVLADEILVLKNGKIAKKAVSQKEKSDLIEILETKGYEGI